MEPIIGLDFGNCFTFPCFIQGIDLKTRRGGTCYDLLPVSTPEGIPSVYFYSRQIGVRTGAEAMQNDAKPLECRVNLLKRKLDKTFTLDGKRVPCTAAITAVVQNSVRKANEFLDQNFHMSTHLVSLSYPATYTYAQRQCLIDAVEAATTADGKNLKVWGTIAEPAAAALDYLSEFGSKSDRTTALTYDLGGGTFDVSLVAAYPEGKQSGDGSTYYYDVLTCRGIETLGGQDFTDVMASLLREKIEKAGCLLDGYINRMVPVAAEKGKKLLSTSESFIPDIYDRDGEPLDIEVTRKEFEAACKNLIKQTIDLAREVLNSNSEIEPDVILMTGGASLMPMVQQALAEAFPQYRERIYFHRPNRAIAYGAARYGTSEGDTGGKTGIIQRTLYDLGIRYLNSQTNKYHVDALIPAGTPIPAASKYNRSYTVEEQQKTAHLPVYEARVPSPESYEVERDFTCIMEVTLAFSKPMEKGSPVEARLRIDERNVLHIDARDPNDPSNTVHNQIQLQNLSS